MLSLPGYADELAATTFLLYVPISAPTPWLSERDIWLCSDTQINMLNRPKTSLDLQFVSLRGYTAVHSALYLCIYHVPPTLLFCLATLLAKLVGLKGFDIAIRFASLAETRVDAIVAALAELSLGPVDGVLGHIVAGVVAGH